MLTAFSTRGEVGIGGVDGSNAVYGVGLRPFAGWDRWFEFRRGHGCLSLVSVVF